jgi:hypothetical protein
MAITVVIGVTGMMGATAITGTAGIMVIEGVIGVIAATDVVATGMAWVGTEPLRDPRARGLTPAFEVIL